VLTNFIISFSFQFLQSWSKVRQQVLSECLADILLVYICQSSTDFHYIYTKTHLHHFISLTILNLIDFPNILLKVLDILLIHLLLRLLELFESDLSVLSDFLSHLPYELHESLCILH
jgi:hypothetical protein